MLRKICFATNFIDLVMACMSLVKFSILLNGTSHGFFNARRRLRQGDPMSPSLFTIFSDLLFRMFVIAADEDKILGYKGVLQQSNNHSPNVRI